MVNDIEFLYHLIIAAGVGALVGVEREHHKGDDVIIAGIRTFPLVSLLGFMLAFLGMNGNALGVDGGGSLNLAVLIGLPIVGALAMGLLYIRFQIGAPGLTTPIALVLTYISGVLVGYGLVMEAVVLSVTITFLLVSKRRLHKFAQVLDDEELISSLQFITVAFIAYPLTLQIALPAPYDVFNRGMALDISSLFLIVIFVSSISFVSFLLIRWKGASLGMKYSGLLGGLVSSEAATISLSNLAKQKNELVTTAAAGILMANATMFVRDLAICGFADPSLATATILALPLVLLFGVNMLLGLTFKVQQSKAELEVRSPFSIGPALKFGAFFVAISAVDVLIQNQFGSQAIYLIALGSLVSSAAVVASVSTLAFVGTIDPWTAAVTAILATAISSINKLVLSRATCRDVSKAVLGRMTLVAALAIVLTIMVLVLRI